MFIVVKYGSNREIVCNPDCLAVNLLKSIGHRCGFKSNGNVIDLSDSNGKLFKMQIYGVYPFCRPIVPFLNERTWPVYLPSSD